MKLTTEVNGDYAKAGNNTTIADGVTGATPVQKTYTATTPLGNGYINNKQTGADGEKAGYTMDVSS